MFLNKLVQNSYKTRPILRPNEFKVLFHYPKQFGRQTAGKDIWSDVNKILSNTCPWKDDNGYDEEGCAYYRSTYTMTFDIHNVAVLKRRNKKHSPCIENWRNDDNVRKSQISKIVGCKPNHWNLSFSFPHCRTKQQTKKALLKEENPTIPSCYNIERYSFQYNEAPGLDMFDIGVSEFKDNFGITWDTENNAHEVVSEIIIIFAGRDI